MDFTLSDEQQLLRDTARNLLQAQDDLETARLSELQAKVGLNTALSALQRLEGLTLDTYHITVPEQKSP